MEYTNKLNLPHHIYEALIADTYTVAGERPSDYSITTLISPIQQTALKKVVPKSALKQRDAIDNFHSFVGTAVHDAFERLWKEEHAQGKTCVVEERLYMEACGKTISGKVDNYIEPLINDYKTVKAYKIIKKDYKSWEEQLNCYAYLLHINGYKVSQLTTTAIVMDWTEFESKKGINSGYPQTPIVTIPIPLWSIVQQKAFIEARVAKVEAAIKLNSPKLISTEFPCSKEDQWSSIKDFAIIKKGAKRATKCFDEEQAANIHYLGMKNKEEYHIEKRVSPRTRCLKYCDVSGSCEQNKTLLAKEGNPVVVIAKQDKPIF